MTDSTHSNQRFLQTVINSWWFTSLMCAIATMAFLWLIRLWPLGWGTVVLLAGALVFVAVLMRNPEFWHRRAAASLMGMLTVALTLSGFRLQVAYGPNTIASFVVDGFPVAIYVVLSFLTVVLLFLDLLKSPSTITAIKGLILERRSEPDLRDLLELVKEDQRPYLLAIIKGVKVLPVDSSKFDGGQGVQIRMKEIDHNIQQLIHTTRRWMILAILVAVCMAIGGIVLANMNAARETTLQAISKESDDLLIKFNDARNRASFLEASVLSHADWLNWMAERDATLKPLADSLNRRIADFKTLYPDSSLSPASMDGLKLATAQVALVLGNPRDVLRTLDADDQRNAEKTYELRAMAFLQLDDWKNAIPLFLGLLATQPNNTDAMNGLSLCYLYSDDIVEALKWQDNMILQLRNDASSHGQELLGTALMNRGVTRRRSAKWAKAAVEDFNEAVVIFTSLKQTKSGWTSQLNLAKALVNRAGYFIVSDKPAEASSDLDKADLILASLEFNSVEYITVRAESLVIRARVEMLDRSSSPKALKHLDETITLLDSVKGDVGQMAATYQLAIAHFRRGKLNASLSGKATQALNDFRRAEELTETLISKFTRKRAETDQALIRIERGNLHQRMNNADLAKADFELAIPVLSNAINKDNGQEMVDEFATALSNLAYIETQLAAKQKPIDRKALENARDKASNAIEKLEKLDDSFPSDRELVLSTAYTNRGLTYFYAEDYESAIHDYQKAADIMSGLVSNGRKNLRASLATRYSNLALALGRKGDSAGAILNHSSAIGVLTTLISEGATGYSPALANCYGHRMQEYSKVSKGKEAVDDGTKAMQICADAFSANPTPVAQRAFAGSLNSLAWLLATCTDVSVQNPSKAIEFATKACELTEWKEIALLDTLAEAYAANGDFVDAVKWKEKAIALAPPDFPADELIKMKEKAKEFLSKQD